MHIYDNNIGIPHKFASIKNIKKQFISDFIVDVYNCFK